jgi:hypothetical protein
MTTTTTIQVEFEFSMGEGAPTCCCHTDNCCGRKIPGLGFMEGPEYYPLLMHVRFSNEWECTCLDLPVEAPLVWQGDQWYCDYVVVPNCSEYNYNITDIWLQCNGSGTWRGGYTWSTGCGDVDLDLVADLNEDGECNPFHATAIVEVTDVYCCGFHIPVNVDKLMKIDFYE